MVSLSVVSNTDYNENLTTSPVAKPNCKRKKEVGMVKGSLNICAYMHAIGSRYIKGRIPAKHLNSCSSSAKLNTTFKLDIHVRISITVPSFEPQIFPERIFILL